MHFGYASVDITPPPGEEMTGYGYFLNRRATGTLDALMARAVAMSDGATRAVVVQLDLLGLAPDFVTATRAQVQRRFGLPPEGLMLHCTHTHSGPGTMQLFACGLPSQHFLFTLQERILGVVGRALEELRPATCLSRFEGDYPDGFAYNRTGGPDLDTHIRGLRVQCQGAPPLLVISYACHPVTLGANREYSADYCGALIRELNAYGIAAIYLNGCCGDVDPLTHALAWGSGVPDTLRIYGRDMAHRVRELLAGARQWHPGPLRAVSRVVPLECPVPDMAALQAALDEHRAALMQDPTDAHTRVMVQWHERMVELLARGRIDEARQAEVQAIACGDVVFVALSAETFTALGQLIRQSAPNHHLMIAATSNGLLGYIADRRDVELGGYASEMACRIYGMLLPAPGAGEKWAQEGAQVVAQAIAG